MMSEASWIEIEALLAEAAALGGSERQALLDARCAGKPGIRSEVESLLASHDRAGEFLEMPILTAAGIPLHTRETSIDANALVAGRFRLLEQIGEGGMGVVYRARRDDGEYDEQVAVKLLASSMHSAEAVRRFRVERQVLATLDHPDIVTLLDAGVTAAGQAYLAMRLVPGVSIAAFCETNRLDVSDRIRLFQRVCAAVHHAHQNGVVHRDLKPANILVAYDGAPKVLDFGVAKLLDGHEHASSTATSAYGPITPNYASPEQLRGLPVTTACDVYALGVLLYELLAGVRPYETAGLPLEEVLATVLERDPPRASAAASAQLPYPPRRLAGDLDAIILKAMSKEPERRYGSAQELSEDLGRHLGGQPVLAREPSLLYVAGRLARRHRAAVSAGAVATLALLFGLGIAVRETRIATVERNRATRQFNDVRQLANALIFKIDEEVRPLAGSTPVRRTIVAEALRYLEPLSADDAGNDPALRLEIARAYHRIGAIQGDPSTSNLGDGQGALRSLTRAIELLQPVGGHWSRDAELERGSVQLTLSRLVNNSNPDGARAAAADAMGIATAILARDPRDVEARRLLGNAHLRLGQWGERDARVANLTRASDTFAAIDRESPANDTSRRNVGLAQKYLGDLYLAEGSYQQALVHHQRALAIDEERLAGNPGDRRRQFDVGIDLSNVAFSQWGLRQFAESALSYERGREVFASLSGTDPKDVAAAYWRARVHTRLARVYHDVGAHEKALTHASEAVRQFEPLKEVDAIYKARYAEALVALGRSRHATGQRSESCAPLAGAMRIIDTLRAANRSNLVRPDEAADGRTLLAGCQTGPSSK
jgi:non-specific serine/threonine protein kinase/serine/threonine-protein kinase